VLEHSNDALTQAKHMAEAANALKTSFLASVSHDLLQPLHATRLTLSVLNEDLHTKASQELLHRADRSLKTLEEIIKTLLDLSKLDAGVSKPAIRGVALTGLLDELFAEFAPAAANRGLVLRRRGEPGNVDTDPLLLRRILQNLLSNAIRYTRNGGVLVYCIEQATHVRIDVADTGPGIRKDRHAAIFEEFQRDHPGIGDEPGFGLGLAIVRRLAGAMGHEIRLWSRTGFGSVFSILVPLAQDGETIASEGEIPPPPPFEGVQVLLVARNAPDFEAAALQLETWGCEVAVLSSREAASVYLQQSDRAPDLLIAGCDQGQVAAGFETISALRAEAETFIPAFIFAAETERLAPQHDLEIMNLPIHPAQLRSSRICCIRCFKLQRQR